MTIVMRRKPVAAARRWVLARCTSLLTKPLATYTQRVPNNIEKLQRTLRKGDVLLVEGDQRISQVIRYLTQSSWSHCAIYVGDALLADPQHADDVRARFGDEAGHLLIEADAANGVAANPLSKYERYNIRICRPEGLHRDDVDAVLRHVIAHMGRGYDVRHIFELARFFFPVSLVPRRWRRAALTFGSTPSRNAAICSTMLADAFTRVGYPILPDVVVVDAGTPVPRWQRWLTGARCRPTARFRRPNVHVVTPRDFDLSPYFEVIKFNHLGDPRLDYRQIVWEDEPGADPAAAVAATAVVEPPPAERPAAEPTASPPARATARRLTRLRPLLLRRSQTG